MVYLSANVYETALRYFTPTLLDPRRGRRRGDPVPRRRAITAAAELVSRQLSPYMLGGQYTLVDPYLHMLASWCPLQSQLLYEHFPSLGVHARLVAERPSVKKADADNAG